MKNKTTVVLFDILFATLFVTNISSCSSKQDKANYLFKTSKSTFSDELTIDGTVESVRSTMLFCPDRIEATIIYLVEDGAFVEAGDTICVFENRELSNAYEQLLQRVEQTKAEYAKSEANLKLQYALLEAEVKNNEAQTQITNLDSAQLKYAPEVQQKITKLELKRSEIEKNRYSVKLKLLETINESELKKLRLQIIRDENRVTDIKSLLDQLSIRAPKSGLVLRAQSPYNEKKLVEGDIVWEGIPVAIMPDRSEMKVIMKVTESDYKRIKLDDSVHYTFSSNPENSASGKIILKAPMGIPVQNNSKVKLFEITSSVDKYISVPEPGISANCCIALKQLSDTIVIPQLAIFDEDSLKFVFVQQGKSFVRKEIMLGNSTSKEAVIMAGLKVDEYVSYVHPSGSKVAKTAYLPDSVKSALKRYGAVKQPENGTPSNNGVLN